MKGGGLCRDHGTIKKTAENINKLRAKSNEKILKTKLLISSDQCLYHLTRLELRESRWKKGVEYSASWNLSRNVIDELLPVKQIF